MTSFAAGFLGIESFTPPWDVIYLPLFNLLIAIYELPFADLLVAIVVLTLVVRTLVAPLSVAQLRSSKEMQRMAPLLREVQRKHKGNRQKILEEQQALYREHGVNPAAGCLPALLQLPILFALYQVLIRASGLVQGFTPNDGNRAAFESLQAMPGLVSPVEGHTDWFQVAVSGPCNLPEYGQLPQFVPLNCQLLDAFKLETHVNTQVTWLFGFDLAMPDHTFALVVGGFALSAIAIVAAILQFIQVKMTMAPPSADDPSASVSTTMLYTFPLMTIFWGAIFPAGLMIYWGVTSLYSIVQQYLVLGWGNLFPLFGWRPSFAPMPQTGLVSSSQRPAGRPEPMADEEDKPRPQEARPRAGARGGAAAPATRRARGARRRGRR